MLPIQDLVAFPGLVFPVHISKESNVLAVDFALASGKAIALTLQTGEEVSAGNLKANGAVAIITNSVELPNGDVKVRLHVQGRILIRKYLSLSPFVKVRVEYVDDVHHFRLSPTQERLMEEVKHKFAVFAQYSEEARESALATGEVFEPGELADFILAYLPIDLEESQRILEERDPFKRLKGVERFLDSRLDVAMLRERISNRAKNELGKSQQEILLREELRQIQAELGEGTDYEQELSGITKQLAKLKMPPSAKKEAERQLKRLVQLHPESSEAALARTYVDWMLDLPWSKTTKDRIDLQRAKEILDRDHYGLEKTKQRILDYLGVRKLNDDLRGPILLLVGPPGVGKTSLGRSIANALGRKFVRFALGGLRDEAEIRGHRRTYVGALPGRIIQSLKTAGSKNPVIMLDELDKVGSDFRGDPSSVLLEVLDPEQNRAFEDHYLNVPFDLSEVVFIGTANIVDTIPEVLLDRMEVIEISGYTLEEKLEICHRYLIPQEQEDNGLKGLKISFSAKALSHLIDSYTQESGVRELRRSISAVFRKVARSVAEGEKAPQKITPTLVEKYLGVVKYFPDQRFRSDQIGVVTGLAWTSVGGQLLSVEVSETVGKGTLSLTGQLGEVMRESAMAALTYVLANAEHFHIDENFYERANVHVHVPQGAIPKDGPSAGAAIATALVSLLTKTPISRNIAMTGEITLRGRILRIGGLREKALAALRVGIPIVIIPKENVHELAEFPKYLLDKVTFVPVETLDDVLKVALVKKVRKEMKKELIRI